MSDKSKPAASQIPQEPLATRAEQVKQEPRVWWVDPSENDDSEDCDIRQYDAFNEHPGQGDLLWQSSLIKVIEHSAYEALERERDELRCKLGKKYETDDIVMEAQAERDKLRALLADLKERRDFTVANAVILERNKLRKELAEAKRELGEWKKIEDYTGCTRAEIYGNAFKLKRGEYGPRAKEDLPSANCNDPEIKAMHDDLCDLLADKGWNEADVCTASTAIWAALKVMGDKRDALKAQADELAGALEESLKHAEEHHDGCLYCGEPLSRVYDADDNLLDSHRKSCWHYSAVDLLTRYRGDGRGKG